MTALLGSGEIVTHSVVLGELAVGNLRNRPQTLADLRALLDARECPPRDVLDFLERHRFFGLGLSWCDVQLLAAAELNRVPLWTLDIRLRAAAETLGLAWTP
jgi:hypothetical protein